jgi:LuxR family transcriptional regulator, maltose regulon positive regulatory protein
LYDLAAANAFVVPLDAARSWYRYHHLFAKLLQLELRCTQPEEVTTLRKLAAGWLAGHGYPVEAIQQAQAARDWGLATRLLADHWPALYLGGHDATVHALMAGFPAGAPEADAELAAAAAGDELGQGSLAAAERYLGLAERGAGSVPEGRRGQVQVLLGVVRLLLAWQDGNPRAATEHAQRLLALTAAPDAGHTVARVGLSDELRALTLIGLGATETWTARLDQAESHLEQAVTLARRIGRPYLELVALVHQAETGLNRRFPRAAELSRQAIELAERHGWTDQRSVNSAYMTLGSALAWQGRLDEADSWLQRAERTVRPELEPPAAMGVQYARGQLELGRGRAADALAAFRAAERLAGPHPLARPLRAWLVHTLVRLGETERSEQFLAGLGERDRDRGEMRIAAAALRLARDDPQAATATLEQVLSGSARVGWRSWLVEAFLLEAIARDALGDPAASGQALEHPLDLAEPDCALLWFLLQPAPDLLERHARRRTRHAALIAQILDLLAGNKPIPKPAGPRPLSEPLSKSEIRVLRYLPTHLSAPEIARELSVSTTTVRTHLRNLYVKLGVHRRAEAVDSARALGLLAPSARQR